MKENRAIMAIQANHAPRVGLPWLPTKDMGSLAERVFVLFDDPNSSRAGHCTAVIVMTTIIVSTMAFVIESMPEVRSTPDACIIDAPTVKDCEPRAGAIFMSIEVVCITIFTIDYLARMLTVPFVRATLADVKPSKAEAEAQRVARAAVDAAGAATTTAAEKAAAHGNDRDAWSPGGGTVLRRYAMQPLNVIDFLAIAPFYVEQVLAGGGGDFAVVRVLRLARVLRLFKMGKHNKGMQMLALVLHKSAPAMQILIFFSLLIVVLFGSLLYFAEGTEFSVAPEFTNRTEATRFFRLGTYVRVDVTGYLHEPTPVRSIPSSFWWVFTTMTTVGYGDLYPTTSAGKVIGIVAFYVGIIFLALPITILGTNFEIVYGRMYAKGEVVGGDVNEDLAAGLSVAEAAAKAAAPLASGAAAAMATSAKPLAVPAVTEEAPSGDDTTVEEAAGGAVVVQRRSSAAEALDARWAAMAWRRDSVSLESLQKMPWIPIEDGWRRTIFVLFEVPSASKLGKLSSLGVLAIIIVSCTTFCMESMPSMRRTPGACAEAADSAGGVQQLDAGACEPQALQVFAQMETAFIIVFTVEFLARVLTVHAAPAVVAGLARDRGGLRNTLAYCGHPLNMVDIAAILPWYIAKLTNTSGGGLAVLRVLRLVRVFRIFKVGKYATGAYMVIKCITQSIPALSILFFLTTLTCVLFASCMYFAEGTTYSVDQRWVNDPKYKTGVYVRPTVDGHDFEPSPFRSIPGAFWWFFTTTTTVGYGDFYPTTTAGKLVGISTFFAGIILLALPVTIIGGNFSMLYSQWMEEMPNEEEDGDGDSGGGGGGDGEGTSGAPTGAGSPPYLWCRTSAPPPAGP
eukprot:g785.t1